MGRQHSIGGVVVRLLLLSLILVVSLPTEAQAALFRVVTEEDAANFQSQEDQLLEADEALEGEALDVGDGDEEDTEMALPQQEQVRYLRFSLFSLMVGATLAVLVSIFLRIIYKIHV